MVDPILIQKSLFPKGYARLETDFYTFILLSFLGRRTSTIPNVQTMNQPAINPKYHHLPIRTFQTY